MPELPEVETIKKGLNDQIKGFVVTGIYCAGGFKPDHQEFKSIVVGSKIKDVGRLGKILFVELDNPARKGDFYIVFHFAMTGNLVVRDFNYPPEKYTKLTFRVEKDCEKKDVRYKSIRMLGYVKLVNRDWMKRKKMQMGKDPFSISAKELLERIRNKKSAIKNVLLDQSVISGIGNIYANEILWEAGVHPQTSASTLSIRQVEDILKASRYILKEAISNKGSTISDYADSYGDSGNQQAYWRVYKREGQSCMRCGTSIIREKIGGRSVFFCPKCQKS